MRLNTLFIYLKNNHGFYSTVQEKHNTKIQEFLKENNIQAIQFIENNISNIVDFVEDILVEGSINIAFYVDNGNFRISSVITKELKENFGNIRVIWLGDEFSYYEYAMEKFKVDICILAEYEETFLKLLSGDTLSESNNILVKNDEGLGLKKDFISTNFENDSIYLEIIDKENRLMMGSGNIISSEKENFDKIDFYKDTMKVDLESKITGIYPSFGVGNNTRQIYIGKNNLKEEQYEKLKTYSSINSTILSWGDNSNLQNNYTNNLKIAERKNYFLSHFHQIYEDEGVKFIKFDGYTKCIEVCCLDYLKVSNDTKRVNNTNESTNKNIDTNVLMSTMKENHIEYLTITSREDFNKFTEDLEFFMEYGKFKYHNVKFILENQCRYSTSGACTIKNLIRFNLDEEMNIIPCNGCRKVVGNINDPYIKTVRKIYKEAEKVHTSRKCIECEVKDSCSKCIMLPEFLSEEEYCWFMKKYKIIDEFNVKKSILRYLVRESNVFSKIKVDDVKFSSKYISHILPNNIYIQGESVVLDKIHLIYIVDMPMIFEVNTGRIMKISKQIALIIEGGLKGTSKDMMIEAYGQVFNVDKNISRKAVEIILDKLLAMRYIKIKE
ncbi:hypothetical protein [Clostridium cellulovorans]|uniref:Uncharacterized protein n=1 Tax=Clostridium cellulovorans (strain ATCC 35296 / DSM 3052 / OCM 3 / 743B) TaxID=573061 RepID=D9SWL2_CLOC7|nr:hypothetical protein [Clostridium cellulovorans]ADL53294.1 hypothetical protein Clocel_3623 [Clostridium cellulovorans 743B]